MPNLVMASMECGAEEPSFLSARELRVEHDSYICYSHGLFQEVA